MDIQFLHISDIHCGYDNYTVGNMRESMPDSISRFVDERGQKIDYIFITGDLKYGKNSPIEYPQTTIDFIKALQEKLCVEPCNTFIVPGNHDVRRGFGRKSAINEIKKNYSTNQGIINSECLEMLSQTMCEFKEVHHTICGRNYDSNHFFIDLGPINIIHLNSALICGEDNEDGSLILGMSILKNALKDLDTNKPGIVLAHHSIDCFSLSEQRELERFLKSKNAVLYLCGHKHVAMLSNISVVEKSKPLWQILCGTNMDQDPSIDQTDMDVFVGTFDTENYTGFIDAYKWSLRNNDWMPDSDFSYAESQTTTGRIFFPSESEYKSSQAIDKYIQYLRYSCSEIRLDGLPVDGYVGSKKFPLDTLYVPIRFKRRLDFQEELELKFDELFGPLDGSIQYNCPLQVEVFNSIILAGPGNGKTTYLKSIISYYIRNELRCNDNNFPELELLPIWIRCRTLNSFSDISIVNIIKSLPSLAEFPPNMGLEQFFFEAVYSKLRKGEVIVLIDGLDEISDSKKRNQLIEQIDVFSKQYSNNRIIITSRIAGYEDYNKSGLNSFKTFEIEPFDNNDIRNLCVRWHKAVVNPLKETIQYANDLADTIISHSRIKSLAVNPLLLTTLLLVQRRIGRLPTKRVALYEESIKVLLETWNQEGHAPMDISTALCKLSYIAYTMTEMGIQQITKRNLVTILNDARDDLVRRLSFDNETPGQFITRTEQRSSLLVKTGFSEDNNGLLQEIYEFQHLTFQEYLASYAIVNKYYPNANRRDRIVDILANKNGIDAFRYNSKKEEIVLLTAALSGWDAEDIALLLINKLKDSIESEDIEQINELSRLSIMMVLDDLELEMETIKELLRLSFKMPTKYVIDSIEDLSNTKYYGLFNIKEISNNWIHSYPASFNRYIEYLDIDKEISNEIIKQLELSLIVDLKQYADLSNAVLMYVLKQTTNNNDCYNSLVKASLLCIDSDKLQLIMQLLNTQYSNAVVDSLKEYSNKEETRWPISDELMPSLLLKLLVLDSSSWIIIKQILLDAFNKHSRAYNELSYKILEYYSVYAPNLCYENTEELFKASCQSINRKKAKVIIDLLRGEYGKTIERISAEEYERYILDNHYTMTSGVYLLSIVKDFKHDKDVKKYFYSHMIGEERSIIDAIHVMGAYYWYYDRSEELSKNTIYMELLWRCIEDKRIEVSYAALSELAFFDKDIYTHNQSIKIVNAMSKILISRQISKNMLFLYNQIQITEGLITSINVLDLNRDLINRVLSFEFGDNLKMGALTLAMLYNLLDLPIVRRMMTDLDMDTNKSKRMRKIFEIYAARAQE